MLMYFRVFSHQFLCFLWVIADFVSSNRTKNNEHRVIAQTSPDQTRQPNHKTTQNSEKTRSSCWRLDHLRERELTPPRAVRPGEPDVLTSHVGVFSRIFASIWMLSLSNRCFCVVEQNLKQWTLRDSADITWSDPPAQSQNNTKLEKPRTSCWRLEHLRERGVTSQSDTTWHSC